MHIQVAPIVALAKKAILGGSQGCCTPPPPGRDEDWVIFISNDTFSSENMKVYKALAANGFKQKAPDDEKFEEYQKRGQTERWTIPGVDIILIRDPEVYAKWELAIALTKRLNLQSREDRIAVHHAIRFGTMDPLPKGE